MANGDDILMTPELASFLGEFGHDVRPGARPHRRIGRLGQATGAGAEAQAIATNVVQKGLNYLQRINLRVDNDYGPATQQALVSWINTLPVAARQAYRIVPATDRHWLYITPNAISDTLREAAARPARARATTTASSNTLSKAAQELQNCYTSAVEFKQIIERYAATHSGRVPSGLRAPYVAWYEATLSLQNAIVARLRSDQTLISAINLREGGRYIPSQLATDLEAARPELPNVATDEGTQIRTGLGAFPPIIILGIVIAVGVTIVLTAYEIQQMVAASNLRARLEATLRALQTGTVRPQDVPDLPGGARDQPPEPTPPFDWIKWLAIALGIGVAGFAVYKITESSDEKPSRNEHRRLRSGT